MSERPFIGSGIRVDNMSPLERRELNRELVRRMREAELRTIRDPDRRYPRHLTYAVRVNWELQELVNGSLRDGYSEDYSEESFP